MSPRRLYNAFMAVMRSRRGHNVLVFLVFLAISTILWCIMSLNDEEQIDVRLPLRITNIPDSVTIITTPPQTLAVSLSARGSQRMKLSWGSAPTVNIDFRLFRRGNKMSVNGPDLKSQVRSAVDASQILLVMPDSLNLYFTSAPPARLPLIVDYNVTAGPRTTIVGTPVASMDSVKVYTAGALDNTVRKVVTEPISLSGLTEPTIVRARVIPPDGSRVIPDSVDVRFNVEPLIIKHRKVTVEPVNVPDGLRLITFPSQVEVVYMISVSDYKNSEPHMRVIADYNQIGRSRSTRNMRLRLTDVSPTLRNVQLASDSAEYIIEHL